MPSVLEAKAMQLAMPPSKSRHIIAMLGRKHITSPRNSAGCIVIPGPIFELVGLKSHHIGHEPWDGGGMGVDR